MSEEIRAYYDEGREIDRLDRGIGPLELARTQELIQGQAGSRLTLKNAWPMQASAKRF